MAQPDALARLERLADALEQGCDPNPAFLRAYSDRDRTAAGSWNDALALCAQDLRNAVAMARSA